MLDKILRRKEVEKLTGLSRSTIYMMMHHGEFPRPIKLSARAVGWLSSDIDHWIEKRIKQSDRRIAG